MTGTGATLADKSPVTGAALAAQSIERPAGEPGEHRRFVPLDSLRGVAASTVMLHH
ncbi:hypothetical protein [Deinococcus sp.]|uniref:hypothetical protein n=1 Tax=Deinococcus sp. TaxID=47478 RepID=UPI003C7CF908